MLPGDRRRRVVLFALALSLLITACATSSTGTGTAGNSAPGTAASGASTTETGGVEAGEVAMLTPPAQPDGQRLTFKYGPIKIEPGQNNITISNLQVPKPAVDGYIVGIHPDLVRDDGSVPPVDVIHLHHGVWLKVDLGAIGSRRPRDAGGQGSTTSTPPSSPQDGVNQAVAGGTGAGGSRFGQIFFAAGEEKTKMILPAGYGYPYKANDVWIINYMLHNLLSTPDSVSIVYDLDFIPADSPGGENIKAARPIWNDVENGKIYPVFDVFQGSGRDGVFTYPDDDPDAYKGREVANEFVVDKDMVLLSTAGHLHPGGLYTDMYVTRKGAGAGAADEAKASITGNKAHIFRSDAVYYEPAGAVSWDVSMTVTPLDWRVSVKKGDVITISSSYDSNRASWYESMGIMVLWAADAADATGKDPFEHKVAVKGALTHGHLAENDNHGGEPASGSFVDMTKLPNGSTSGTVDIIDFAYAPGDMSGIYPDVPTIKPGQALRFVNKDPQAGAGIWHTITACKAPCDKSTGVAYPLADADVQFDSGELGKAGPPTAGTLEWSTPTSLVDGTYTYFCRIHPSMRGAFRVAG